MPMASQVDTVIKAFFADTKGEGAKKITGRIRKIYVGVSESAVQKTLNAMHVMPCAVTYKRIALW